MRRPKLTSLILILLSVFLLGIPAVYNLPAFQARLGWRVAELFARFKYALSPPEQIVFVPVEGNALPTQTIPPRSSPPIPLSATSTQIPSIKQPVASPTIALTRIPKSIQLDGVQHEYQTWNNCGPATLGMALSYWDLESDQRPIAAFTKPNPRDKNVMPYEMAAYVKEETQLMAEVRVGGDIRLLKRFLAAGLPVIIEKGFEGPDFKGWMGHYVLVTGYSDQDQTFTLQDSFYGPDQIIDYKDLESNWRAFNFTYLVVYPPDRLADITEILGQQSDKEYNYTYAAQKASDDIYGLAGRDQFFAWFNRGTNLVQLQDYASAAVAYDEAFALYPAIPEKERPWRMMWYQIGPYQAYYYTGRYKDVITLSTTTLDAMSEPVLEESYYWRALAREALGDTEGAIKDLRSALNYHPGFEPALTQLQQLGVAP
jgi:tetratricopeptide (TPR) repeat protein